MTRWALFCVGLLRAACVDAAQDVFQVVEDKMHLPAGLLKAIAICESSKWEVNKLEPHPWAVSVNGSPTYFKSKEEAVAEVKNLQKRGVENIDVGYMQINLYYHGKEFASIEDALDPMKNIEYGAKLLKQRRARSSSWTEAVSRYHSKKSAIGAKYLEKVIQVWRAIRNEEVNDKMQAELNPVLDTANTEKPKISKLNDLFYKSFNATDSVKLTV